MATAAYLNPTSAASFPTEGVLSESNRPTTESTFVDSLLRGLQTGWFGFMDALAQGFEDKAFTPIDPAGTFSSWFLEDS